jgi:5S rRNA maturation endonuclease (ribonuclease M5)
MAFKPSLELTVNNILSKVTEYDIFKTYCSNFKEVDRLFVSELRKDKNPTCKVFVNEVGKLIYKDYNGESHNCFTYVRAKYGCSFNNALNIINKDFNLNFKISWDNNKSISTNNSPTITNQKFEIKINKITKKRRNWSKEDLNYWGQYDITQSTLEYFNVEPLEFYWINYNRFKCDLITYSYEFGCGYRDIYSPHNLRSLKWPCSNTKADKHIYGLKQLPKTGDLLFIVSSLKEVMFLYELGITAIAPQSESTFIPQHIIDNLKLRFKEIIILFDFDKAGCNHSLKHSIKFNLKRLKFCPVMISYYEGKDLTDCYVKDKEKILKLLNEYERYL